MADSNNELVSIVMPSYNTAQFIRASIDSVLAQTYGNWELLIVDDCSTDETTQIIATYGDPRIRFMCNEVNSGAAVSRNRALREARGRWIAFLDSDDLWLPEKLEKQIVFMEEGNFSFSYTDYELVDEIGTSEGTVITGPDVIDKRRMYRYCYPGALTVIYDAKVIGLVQVADLSKNNDYAMWLQVVEMAEAHRLPEVLASYRRRAGSISSGCKLALIRYHYALFRVACGLKPLPSAFCTARNLIFGMHKKIKYKVRREG